MNADRIAAEVAFRMRAIPHPIGPYDSAALSVLSALAEENERLRKVEEQYELCQCCFHENAALKAEVERLTELAATIELEEYAAKERLKVVSARAEKAEAELELGNKAWDIKQKQLEKAEAELDAARPLLEAVEKAELFHYQDGTVGFEGDERPNIISAALAYRARKDAEVKK
jgi:multidrug efflux pump subunit AcrA (membrane-fusion protein)